VVRDSISKTPPEARHPRNKRIIKEKKKYR
jgi:hypothetical protein